MEGWRDGGTEEREILHVHTTYLIISLCSTMRFNSFTTREPTHTDGWMNEGEEGRGRPMNVCLRTLFADERVVPVVGVVRIAKSSVRIFEFEKLVAVLARVTRAFCFEYTMTTGQRAKKRGEGGHARKGQSVRNQRIGREICVLVSVVVKWTSRIVRVGY